jgi:transcriptional regulator with XRE-family HTH domain
MTQGAIELHKWRKIKGLSQLIFAEYLGVSQVDISHWETCRRTPNLGNAFLIQGVTGISAELWLKEEV